MSSVILMHNDDKKYFVLWDSELRMCKMRQWFGNHRRLRNIKHMQIKIKKVNILVISQIGEKGIKQKEISNYNTLPSFFYSTTQSHFSVVKKKVSIISPPTFQKFLHMCILSYFFFCLIGIKC